MLAPWEKSYGQPGQHIRKQRHSFANKGPSVAFPVVMYWCDSWTIKKADHRRIDAFLNCSVGEDSWGSLGQEGDQISPS